MGEVAHGGRTVLFVSHNMAAISRLCNKAMLLSHGQLVKSGDDIAVIQTYLQNSLKSEGTAELKESVHLVSSPVQVRRIEVLNSHREPSGVIFFGEDIHIRLSVEVRESVEKMHVGIGIYAEGVRVTTLHSDPVDLLASPGLRTFVCSIPGGSLLPNFYSLHTGAYSCKKEKGLDWVPDAISFRIEAVKADGSGEHDEKAFGLVSLNVSWAGSELPPKHILSLSRIPS